GERDVPGDGPIREINTSAVSAGWSAEDHEPLVFCMVSSQAQPFSTACRTSWRREMLPGGGVEGLGAFWATAVKPQAQSATAKGHPLCQRLDLNRLVIESR